MATVMTMNGQVRGENLGVVDYHEHLAFDAPQWLLEADGDFQLNDPEKSAEELKTWIRAGGRTMIDMTAMTVRAAPGPRVVSRGYAALSERDFKSLVMPDGRRVDYLILGAPRGRPVLYLPLDFGLVRWPAFRQP